jgi:hypothetical protein
VPGLLLVAPLVVAAWVAAGPAARSLAAAGGTPGIVSDGRSERLYLFADCRLQTVADSQGAPFLRDLRNLRDHGTGIGCSDLGPPSAGRHPAGLQALNNSGQWTVRRTEIDLNGMLATIGQSDIVTPLRAGSRSDLRADDQLRRPHHL